MAEKTPISYHWQEQWSRSSPPGSSPQEITRSQRAVRATVKTKTIMSPAWFGNVRTRGPILKDSRYIFSTIQARSGSYFSSCSSYRFTRTRVRNRFYDSAVRVIWPKYMTETLTSMVVWIEKKCLWAAAHLRNWIITTVPTLVIGLLLLHFQYLFP